MIIQDGLRRMYAEQEDVFYYLTADERELPAPGHARRPRDDVTRASTGMYLLRAGPERGRAGRGCSCWAAAPSCARSIAGGELLAADFGVAADIWSCPSFTELRRDGLDAERWNLLHPAEPQRIS